MAGRPRRTSVGWYFFPAVRPASSRAGGTPTTARSGAGRSSSTTRTGADPPAFLCLHEVGAAGQVDQVRLEPRGPAQKVRHLVELVEEGARRGVLAAEVIEQEDTAIGFEVDGRLVIAHQRVEGGR